MARQSRSPRRSGAAFRRSYDALERQRSELIARLGRLGADAVRHPAYGRALDLLNATFRKASVVQRIAVLDAACWLIDVLERLTSVT